MNNVELEARNLAFSYPGERELFRGLSLKLRQGDIFSILGANGAGKSTLLSILSGLLRPASGVVMLRGRDIASMNPREIAKSLGFVPQVHEQAFGFTVQDYLVMGRTPYLGFGRQPKVEDYHFVERVMEQLHIETLAEQSYNALSGGERQQVAIARALVQDAGLILLDEPTNHLDFGNQLRILRLIVSLAEQGHTIVLTTHQPDHSILLGGQVGVLDENGKMTIGCPEEIITQLNMEKLYGIDLRVLSSKELGRRFCTYGSLKGDGVQ